MVFGTYHCVWKDYLSRYIDEQVYRWNTCMESVSFRFQAFCLGTVLGTEEGD